MGQLPKTSSLMDLNQVVSLTGKLSWDLSAPSTISFGDTALLPIKGNAPPYTWAIVGAAAGTKEYYLKYTQTEKLQNVLYSDLSATNLPIVEVVDARGNRITQSMIEIPLPPTADLIGDTPVVVGISGDYDASGSSASVGASIKKIEWDWSYDGIYFVPSGDTGTTNSHTYAYIGNYTVAVRVRDNYNRTDIATLPIEITIPAAPTAGLTGDQVLAPDESGDYDATTSTPGVGGTIISYEWDWSYDGVTFDASGDTGSTQSHSYSSEDTYTVAVRVTDDYGSSDIATLEVVVSIPEIIAWTEVAGQLNSQAIIYSLVTLNGEIYGGTSAGGRLFKWNSVNAWTEVAGQIAGQTAIYSLIVLNGEIYGGSGSNGELLKWNGVNAWTEVATQLNGQIGIQSLTTLNGEIYGGTANGGKLFKWDGVNAWTEVADTLNGQLSILSLVTLNGEIYGGTAFNGRLFKWNGVNAWTEVAGQLNSETRIFSLVTLNGEIYGGTSPNGKLYKWDGVNAWTEVADTLNGQLSILSLIIFNGGIYGGTSPNGELFKWNGVNAWTEVAGQLNSQISIYSLVELTSEIYGGTANGGRLFKGITA